MFVLSIKNMKKISIDSDIKVYGFEVDDFPKGIAAAFDKLIATLPAGSGRPCFGLSQMKDDGTILYIAAIEQHDNDEAAKNNCISYTIPKGNYLSVEILDWMPKVDSIKDVFGELMRHPEASHTAWCIEWYKSDKEMLCLLQTK